MTTLDYLKQFIALLKKRILIISVLCGLVFVASYKYHKSIKGTYGTYSKIFPLSINNSSGGGSLQALKAQFGMSEKSDLDKIYNIIELVNSKNISLKVVQQPGNNKALPTIADMLIADRNANLAMFEKKINIERKDSISFWYTARDILLQNTLVSNDKTEFYTITTTAHSKELAQLLNEAILSELSILYVNMTTEKPRSDLKTIKFMRDSLNRELTAVERAIAGYRDSNQYSVKQSIVVPQRKLERTRLEIEELYTNTAAALQNAKFKLLSESPIFQILDKPGEPYKLTTVPAIRNALLHALLAFCVLAILFTRRVFGQIIMDELKRA